METPARDNGGVPTLPRPPRFDAKKSFEKTSAMDRAKRYLKDVPVLHARLENVIEAQEANLTASKESLAKFDSVTAEIQKTVDSWEKDSQETKANG